MKLLTDTTIAHMSLAGSQIDRQCASLMLLAISHAGHFNPGQVPRSCRQTSHRGSHSLEGEIYVINAKAFDLLARLIEQ